MRNYIKPISAEASRQKPERYALPFGMLLIIPWIMISLSVEAIVLDDLNKGGFVIFFRHTERDLVPLPEDIFQDLENRGECVPGTELNQKGKDDALRIGQKIKSRGLKIKQSYASPTCRTRQMGELMFGHPIELRRELVYNSLYRDSDERKIIIKLLKILLSDIPSEGSRILLSHEYMQNVPELGVGGLNLNPGDAAIFKPLDSAYEYLGIIPLADWVS